MLIGVQYLLRIRTGFMFSQHVPLLLLKKEAECCTSVLTTAGDQSIVLTKQGLCCGNRR